MWNEVYNSIYTGKDIIEIVNTMSGVVSVRRILQCREDVDVVIGGLQVVKSSSMAMRRR